MNFKKITTGTIATVFAFSCSLQNTHTTNEINKENMNFSTKAKNYKVDLSNYNPKNKTDLQEEKRIKTEKINKKLATKKKFKFKTKACSNPVTPIKAGLVPINDQITFTLTNQPQYFKFYVQAGQRIKISQSELDANDSYLKLFRPSNLNIPFITNDDTYGLDSYIDTVADQSGFWVIQVSTYEEAENCQAPIGNFKLNVEVDNIYNSSPYSKKSHVVSAMDKNGNYAIIWQLYRNGTWDIIGGSFDKNGVPLGPRFAVNNDGNNIPGDQLNPAIAMNRETGDFIVTWNGFGNFYYPAPETSGVFFNKFNINGVSLLSSEPLVNQGVNGHQINPDVTIDDTGNAVIVWETTGSTNNTDGIYMRKIQPNGNFLGSEIKVNQSSNNTTHPKVAIVPKVGETNRQVLVVWQGNGVNDNTGIFQRKISYDFGWMDNEGAVNSFQNGLQSNPDLAFDYDGRAVVTWQTTGSTDNSDGIKVIAYNIDSSISRPEFRANNTITDVSFPSLAVNQSAGIYKSHYRVVWEGSDPNLIYGSASTIFHKWFTLSDHLIDLSVENRYYLPSNGNNGKPSIAMNADSTNDANLISNPFDTNISKFNISFISNMSTYMEDGIYNKPISSNDYGIYNNSFIY